MPELPIEGANLHYEDQGEGPAVLYVHGSGDFGAYLEQAAELTRPGFRTIRYDRRGFGGSREVLAASLPRHVRDASLLLDELHAAPAIVVGSSAGGVLALSLAIAHPEQVRALVLAEPAFQCALALTASITAALARAYFRRFVLRDLQGAALGLYRWITAYDTGGNQFDAAPEALQRASLAHAPATLREVTQLIFPWPSLSAIGAIECPVTLLVGDRGQPLFHRTSQRVRRALPHCTVVPVRDSAHLIAVDRPQVLADAVRAMQASLGRVRAGSVR